MIRWPLMWRTTHERICDELITALFDPHREAAAWSARQGRFLVRAHDGRVATSPDGHSWTPAQEPQAPEGHP